MSMKTLVITTKNPEKEYMSISENWFKQFNKYSVESEVSLAEEEQSIYNNLKVLESNEYRIILPEVAYNVFDFHKADYVLDLMCSIAKAFNVKKQDIFCFIHSRDLFNDGDSRGGYGIVFNQSLSCSDDVKTRVDNNIAEFHHDKNQVADLLLYSHLLDGEDISILGNALYEIIKMEARKKHADI